MKNITLLIVFVLFLLTTFSQGKMMFGDTSHRGVPYSKDPHVVKFEGRYLMYFQYRLLPTNRTQFKAGI